MDGRVTHGFEHIIAATDLSECAGYALEYAKVIALKCDASLSLVNAQPGAPSYASMYSTAPVADSWTVQRAEALIALEEAHGLQLPNLPHVQRLVTIGAPATTILATAKTLGADLITMGTRGRTGLRPSPLGSTAETVIRDSECSVLTVPCRRTSSEPKFERVLLAISGARSSRDVFERAAVLAEAFGAELVVVSLAPAADALASDLEPQQLRSWLGGIAPNVRTKFISHRGDAAEQMVWQARQEGADVLVIGLRTPANSSVLPVSVKTLIRHSPCPVLTVPASRNELNRI